MFFYFFLFCGLLFACLLRGHTGRHSGVPLGSALSSGSWQAQRTIGDVGIQTAICLDAPETRQVPYPVDYFHSVRCYIFIKTTKDYCRVARESFSQGGIIDRAAHKVPLLWTSCILCVRKKKLSKSLL